jgi:capsular polysaccharide biosynthesis protein
MELQYILRFITQRWWIIALIAVLTTISAYSFSALQPERYKATVQLIILSRPDAGQTMATRNLLHTYASRFQSTQRMQYVIDELQLDMTSGSLLSKVRVGASTDSNIITVEVENSDPEIAKRIAYSLAVEFIQWRNEDNTNFRQEDRIRAELLDEPQVGKVGSPLTNAVAGFVLGIAAGTLVVSALEWLDARFIRSSEEAELLLGISVIGVIPHMDKTKEVVN